MLPALAIAVAAPAAVAAVDLTGRWRVEGGAPSPTLVEITQTGGTVTIPTGGFSGTAGQLQGTVAAAGDVALTGSGPCTPFEFRGRLLPDEDILHGTFASSCPLLTLHSLVFTRCGCFDGNATNGDGCDATCQVEPCFACSGALSVCSDAPRTSCRTSTAPERAVLKIDDRIPDTKDVVDWKWPRGTAPAGGTCAGKPCWTTKGNGACIEARYDAAGVLVNDAEGGKFKARASAAP